MSEEGTRSPDRGRDDARRACTSAIGTTLRPAAPARLALWPTATTPTGCSAGSQVPDAQAISALLVAHEQGPLLVLPPGRRPSGRFLLRVKARAGGADGGPIPVAFGCRRPTIAFIVLPPRGAPSQWRRRDHPIRRPCCASFHPGVRNDMLTVRENLPTRWVVGARRSHQARDL
jgi:hypothetical protein